MDTLNEIASNPFVMKWAGAIVLAMLGYAFMRARRHSSKECFAFAGGIFGIIVVLSLIKYFLFS